MNQPIIDLLNKEVGRVRVSKPVDYTDRGFECAAWWEHIRSETGVFPVLLRQDQYNKRRLYLCAEVPATIVEDCFVSLFCGNVIAPYDAKKNAGNKARQPVRIVREFTLAIQNTSNSDDAADGTKIAIRPEHWPAFVEYCHLQVQDAHRGLLEHWWPKYSATHATEDIGMVGHMGDMMHDYAKQAEEIDRLIRWRQEHDARGYSEYSPDYYLKNNPFMQ